MKKFKKIILSLLIVVVLFSLPVFAYATPVYYETYFGYTAAPSVEGYNINPSDGSHMDKTDLNFGFSDSNNVASLNFGLSDHYQGYQINLRSNIDLDLTPAKKYRLEGVIEFAFKPSMESFPSRFYIQIGFDDVNYNHQIIKVYTAEDISNNLTSYGVFRVEINDVFDAIHADAVSKLQINYNFVYPDQDSSGNYWCTVTEFKITPTLANDSTNVLFAWDSYVETSSNPSIPFNQVTYENGVSFEFGQGISRNVYAVHAKARDDKTLVAGYPYQIAGTVSIRLPDIENTVPYRVDVVIGETFTSSYNFWSTDNASEINGDYLVLGFDTFGIAAKEELDIYIRIDYEHPTGSERPNMSNSNFLVTVSPFTFRYVSAYSSDYNNYLSNEKYLSDYSKFQFSQVDSINNDALTSLYSLAPAFSFVGNLVTHGISSIPFLSSLFSISLAIGLGAFLFGLFSTVSGKFGKSAGKFLKGKDKSD